MLQRLNDILNRDLERPIAFLLNSFEISGINSLRNDVALLHTKINSIKASKWLLYSDDSYQFLVGFIALLCLKKDIVICANSSTSWISEFSDEFEAVLSDREMNFDKKTAIDFLSDEKSNPENRITYDITGEEKVTFFTSGSTGKAKAVIKQLRCLTNEISTLEETFGSQVNSSCFAATVSHLHIYGLLFKILWPLLCGRIWIKETIEYPEQLVTLETALRKGDIVCMGDIDSGITLVSSPAFLSRLDLALPPIIPQAIFSSGGPLAFKDAKSVNDYFHLFPIEVYGSTETGGIGYRQQKEDKALWQPFSGISLKACADNIELRSPHVTTKEWLFLDDKLAFNEKGWFSLVGRKDRVLKIEEKRVSLTEIENFIESFDTVKRCIAILISGHRQQIGCIVQLTEKGKAEFSNAGFNQLVKHWKLQMKNHFEAVTIPRKWRQLDSIPINSQSKLIMEELIALFNGAKETGE